MQFIPWRIVINSPPFSTESTVFSDRLLPVVKWAGNTESISRFSTVEIARCFDPVSISVYLEEFYLLRRANSTSSLSFFRWDRFIFDFLRGATITITRDEVQADKITKCDIIYKFHLHSLRI